MSTSTNPKRMFIHTLLLLVLPIGKKLVVGVGFGFEANSINIFIHFKGWAPHVHEKHTQVEDNIKEKRQGETSFKNLLAMLEVSDNFQRYLNTISSMNSNMKVKGIRLHTWSRLLQTIFLVNVKKSAFLVSSQIMSKERSHTRKGDIRVGF